MVVFFGIGLAGLGAGVFIDNLIYGNIHHQNAGMGFLSFPILAICGGLSAMFIDRTAIPHLKGGALLFYRLGGLLIVCIACSVVAILLGHSAVLWQKILFYINDIGTFLATGRPVP